MEKELTKEIVGVSEEGFRRNPWDERIGTRREDRYDQKKWWEQIKVKTANSRQPG